MQKLERNLRRPLRLLKKAAKRAHGRGVMGLVGVGSSRPLSANWGFDRGTPIDRYYIEAFLARHASDVRGHVLEVKEDDYSRRFGGARVTRQDIISLDAENSGVTIIGDLADPATLPAAQFDCIILTQTLHLVFDMAAAISNIRRALRPGGVALITVPGISPVALDLVYPWYWSLSEQALHRLLREQFDENGIDIAVFGNLFAATAFLHAASIQDVPRRKLDLVDPAYPITVAARVVA